MELQIYLRGLGLSAAGATLWLLYFDSKDRLRPEPRRRLLSGFLWGLASAALALGSFTIIDRAAAPATGPGHVAGTALLCFGYIGPIEEACKALPFLLFIRRFPEFDERIDGVIYASTVAIGFAAFETILWVSQAPFGDQIARALTAPLTHSIFAAIWGFGFAQARFVAATRRSRVAWSTLPFLVSSFAHGLYDFVLLAFDATVVASGVALVVWVGVLQMIRRANGGLPRSRVLASLHRAE